MVISRRTDGERRALRAAPGASALLTLTSGGRTTVIELAADGRPSGSLTLL
ncbi:hypothetical protein ACIRYZ_06925 [Kitasatospora sp. NPDC101155]|uniref:hypothetical protein n=1 Tax=Kitasatospora sp. NPDC101155 TaxID=3364097 RepID=UPI0037F705FB